MNYQIRQVERRDINQLIELCAAHALYEQCDYITNGKSEMLELALFTSYSKLKCLVVEMDHKLVGYSTFIKQFSTWDAAYYLYMDCLYLRKEYRGYGIGTHVLNEIKLKAAEMGCQQIQWQTPTLNEKAIKFYSREGANYKSKARFFFDNRI